LSGIQNLKIRPEDFLTDKVEYMKFARLKKVLHLLLLLPVGIFLAEVVAMLLIYFYKGPYELIILLDATITTALVLPLIYFVSYRPLLKRIAEQEQGENVMQIRLKLMQFAASNPVDELLQATLDEIETLTGSSIGFFHFLEADQKTLWLQAWSTNTLQNMCRAEGKGSHYSVDEAGVWADSVRQRQAVIQNDYTALPHRKGMPEEHAPVIREISAPIIRDGKVVAVLGVGNKLQDYTEDDVELVSTLADFTWDIIERKRAEEKLEKERNRLRSILDTMPDGIYIVDQQYDIEYVNPVIERDFGLVNGQKCYAYFCEGNEPCSWCKNEAVFAGERFNWEWQSSKSGKTYEVFDSPITNLDGSISKLKLIHDVTQRKTMEVELETRNQELLATSKAEHQHRQLAEALVEASLVLNRSLNLDEVLKIILEQIKEVIPYKFSYVGLLEEESFYIASQQSDTNTLPIQPGIMKRFLLADFPLLKNVRQFAQPVLVPDTDDEPDWKIIENFEWVHSFLSAPLVVEENVIGFVNLFAEQPNFFTHEMRDLLAVFAAHAAVALQNAWLFEQVRASSERLQSLSRRLVEVQENERNYIARELHDEAGQVLTSLIVDLRLLEKNASDSKAVLKLVKEMENSLNTVSENLHRVAMALRPASLDHLGIIAALRQHVEAMGEKQGIKVSFSAKISQERLPKNMETVLYRIVQEAITNVVRHAHATRMDVMLTMRNDKLIVIVEDDGVGFDPKLISTGERLGLFGMRERAEMIDGNLIIESAPGKGTTIMIEVDYVDTNTDR